MDFLNERIWVKTRKVNKVCCLNYRKVFESVQSFVHGRTPLPDAPCQGVPHDDQGDPEQDLDALAHEHVPDA